MKHLGSVELETDRLILRKLRVGDAQEMFDNWANDSEVTKYLRWLPHKDVEFTKELIKEWIKEYKNLDYYQWGVELKDTHELVGTISIVDSEDGEIGYCYSRKIWGQGIGTEALKRVIAFLLDDIGYPSVVSKHDIDNPASGVVMEKAGMKFIGNSESVLVDNHGKNVMCKLYFIQR